MKHSQNDQRALEAIKVKTCDVSTAGTDSATIQFTFCNQEFKQGDLECAFDNDCGLLGHNDTKLNVLDKCCRTNKFGWYNSKRSLWQGETLKFDGNTNDDDGGDKLGPCEGFEITGSKVFSYGKNLHTYVSICITNNNTQTKTLHINYRFMICKDFHATGSVYSVKM